MAAQALSDTVDTPANAADHANHAGAAGMIRFGALSSALPWPQAHQPAASPLLAQAWVNAIVHFWNTQCAAGAIDQSQPLYLIDPAPGDGELAGLILQTLDGILSNQAQTQTQTWTPCYVACADGQAQLDWLAGHPWLTPYRQKGWFDTALLSDYRGAGLQLRAQSVTLLRAANPVVILGWQWLGTLSNDLVAAEQGQCWEGLVAVDGASGRLDYRWQKTDAAALEQSRYRHLLQDCLQNTAGVPVLMPVGACTAVDYFSAISGGYYLLLSADHGSCRAQQLRLRTTALPQVRPPAGGALPVKALPVNYHALSLHQRRHGATTWNSQLDDDGMVLHAACAVADNLRNRNVLDAIVGPLAAAHPDLAQQLVARAGPLYTTEPATLLGLLMVSGDDPAVLQAGMAMLQEQTPQIINTALRNWQSALCRTWSNTVPGAVDDGFSFAFCVLAARLGHWGLAKTCLYDYLAMYGQNPHGLHHLAFCHAVTGERSRALQLLSLAIEATPGDAPCLDLQVQLSIQAQRHLATSWYHPEVAREGELTLEPLGPEHAESLFYQYRDGQIGIMARLPELTTVEQTSAWIAQENANPCRHACAVIHACWGFIGVVSLQRDADAGYFYFWIGTDFQDRGWGQQAARLFLAQVTSNGIDGLFTSVYQDNLRSRRALLRLGFEEMAVRAQAPNDDLIFFHLPVVPVLAVMVAAADDGEDSGEDERVARLHDLCAAIDFKITFNAGHDGICATNDCPD